MYRYAEVTKARDRSSLAEPLMGFAAALVVLVLLAGAAADTAANTAADSAAHSAPNTSADTAAAPPPAAATAAIDAGQSPGCA